MTDLRLDFDFLALNSHTVCAVKQYATQRTLGLKSDQQKRRFPAPEVGLEMMTDAPSITHATGRDDDKIAADTIDCFALLHCFSEMDVGCGKRLQENFAMLYLSRMTFKYLGCSCRQRGIDENRCHRNAAVFH